METCQVGLFRLPGLKFEKDTIPEELRLEMVKWAEDNNCGMPMNEWLWSFKTAAQRDWFILRWTDQIPKEDLE
jgi:hypothetical protein